MSEKYEEYEIKKTIYPDLLKKHQIKENWSFEVPHPEKEEPTKRLPFPQFSIQPNPERERELEKEYSIKFVDNQIIKLFEFWKELIKNHSPNLSEERKQNFKEFYEDLGFKNVYIYNDGSFDGTLNNTRYFEVSQPIYTFEEE